jgi:putative copper resistance protein D
VAVLVVAAFASAAWLARTSSVLAGDVYGRLGLPWLRDLAADQLRGGAVVLFVVVPACVVLSVLVIVRSVRGPADPRR